MRNAALWFNTLIAAAAAAGVTLAAVGVLLVMSNALAPSGAVPFSWFDDALTQADALRGGREVVAWVLAIGVGILGVILALIELRLLLPAHVPALLISDDDLGRTTIERDSAESYLALAVDSLESVETARIRARGNRDGSLRVRARLNLSANRDTDVPHTVEQARGVLSETSSEQLGLEITDLAVTTAMQRSHPRGRRRRRLLR